ncbi:autotransporter assembly complex protein TamA [Shewanella sp. 1CM18E]|uniref:autotransporter assembly complex protein TamA n=1 Tax=Shewanella sp. 1CM18E TaxID=2929169 RepID=UPI0020C109D3|nr:autotransporter assembly complex family protein [Shewanella sp. 1CM18E]MCK8045243.1 autotransporter assembly complex protein TamA [Shewanella sp. 1CM18E]
MATFSVRADDWLSINIKGVKGALATNIKAHLGSLPESSVQRRAFIFNAEDNIEAAMHSMGYYHSKVTQDVINNGDEPWRLNLTITPGEPTLISWIDIQVKGEMQTDPLFEKWLSQLTIRPGDRLNHGVYDDIKSQLLTLALARGYFDGKFDLAEIVVDRDFNTAKIALYYDSGQRYHIGEVTFTGHTLEPEILDELVPFKLDAPYSTGNLGQLNRQLLDTGYFSNIKVLPLVEQVEGLQVPIRVELSPRPNHSIELGLGADIGNTVDNKLEPRVRVTWRTPQINKYGHSQETTAEWSPDKPKFLTTYTIPLTHPLDDQLKLRIGMLRDKYGVTQVYDSDERQFNNTGQLESSKMLFAVIRQQRLQSKWLFNYSAEVMKESYQQSGVDYDPRYVLFGTSLSKTTRGDNSLDPKSGFFQFYSLEYADPSLGSEVRLARLQTKFKWIETFFDKHRIVSRLDMAANLTSNNSLENIPPSLRYFAGGDQSIRGYSYNELGPSIDSINEDGQIVREVVGGRYLMVGSIEYQYYVTPTWRVATFIDAGNAFDVNQIELITSVGAGIHWISPIGPVKLDVGVGLKETDTISRPWRIHITMGAEL